MSLMVGGQQLPCDSFVLTCVDGETFAELPWSNRGSRLHLFAEVIVESYIISLINRHPISKTADFVEHAMWLI